ncbi:MAG TPA: PaaI family thioesterase [Nevskiales bacterium]|nr:PaaI family thioesterase [Nevskiales bacterium]
MPAPDDIVTRIPYAAFLGIRIARDADGLLFQLPYAERLVGNRALPALHGGVVAGFMENAALLHLMYLEPRQVGIPKTIDFSIDYLRSAGPRESLARCEVTRLGRRVAQVQIRCWQENAAVPVAVARAHFLLGGQVPVA